MSTRSALITGAAGGIGSSLCREFRAAGYYVVGLDRREAECDADRFVRADLARFAGEEAYRTSLAAELRAMLPGARLDVLVNNAAVQILGSTEEVSEAGWRETFDVNVLAPFLLAQQFVVELGSARGSIINISSIHAVLTKPGFVSYAASKAALVGLTRSLAVDLGGRVRVNAICPAAIGDTAMLDDGFSGRPEAYAQLAALHPSGRVGTPADVARCALFLADAANDFLTGTVLGLDGGIGARLHDPL